MSRESMSGVLMFLRYAFPCAEAQLAKGVIDTRDYALLQRWINQDMPPMIELLEQAFPEAVFKLKELSTKIDREPWSLNNVLDFWRNHHDYKNESCNVRVGKIKKIDGQIAVMDDNSMAFNIYALNIIVGRAVHIHRDVIIEVI